VNNLTISGTETPVLLERERQVEDFKTENYHKLDEQKLDDLIQLLLYVKKEQEERAARKAHDVAKERRLKEEQLRIKKDLQGRRT